MWYRYSPSWHGRYPQKHLAAFKGKLQVDAYAGFEPLFVATEPGVAASVLEIACFARVRRKWFDLYEAHASPLAREALDRIGQLYRIETAIRGQSADERCAARQKHAVPLLAALHAWMIEQSAKVDQHYTRFRGNVRPADKENQKLGRRPRPRRGLNQGRIREVRLGYLRNVPAERSYFPARISLA